MFENVIGQNNIVSILRDDIEKKSLNNSMIFYGPKSSGKLTAALEMVRVLNCKNNGILNCSCINCNKNKNLSFEGLIFLSRRNFTYILNENIKCFKLNKNEKFLIKIFELLKLISLPLQDFIVNDSINENDKKKISTILEKFNDFIINKNKITDKNMESLSYLSAELNQIYKTLNIPVATVRAMLDWTYFLMSDINKVVIIDHVDYLEKASQNILLKRLEEPSKNLYFILLSENKNKINQTIISRCRNYYFKKLENKSISEIIKRDYNQEAIYNSLEDFFLKEENYSKANIFPSIVKFINFVFQKETPFSELIFFINSNNDKKYLKVFITELILVLEKEILRRNKIQGTRRYILLKNALILI